jgi:glycosyltransferase involved in cell wall biosynthesis
MKISFVVWARYHRRAELLAHHLGASIHYIYRGRQGRFFTPVRYLTQTWQTWRVLSAERPDVLFVQNPPIFSVLVAFLYCRLYGARCVIDSHSGAFQARWRWSVPIHRLLSKGALLTIVHNKDQEAIVAGWGCRCQVIAYTAGDYPRGEDYSMNGQFNVTVISTYEEDEPLPAIWGAAARMPQVAFYVTGDPKHLSRDLLEQKPENCHLTGYLPYERYVGLIRGSDAVLDLTRCNHTLPMGGFEAVSMGKPLIVSDFPVLREYFSLGTLHVPNTTEGICAGVRKAQSQQEELQQEMNLLHERLDAEWKQNLSALKQLLRES